MTLSIRMTSKNGNAGLTSTTMLWDWHLEVNSSKSVHCCTVSENKPTTFYLQLVFRRRIKRSILKWWLRFDDYFKIGRGAIFERAHFNHRNQLPYKTAEEYVTFLFDLVDSCNYGDFREEMLRDRLMVGVWDVTLSERLQMDNPWESHENGQTEGSRTQAQ